MGLLNIGTRALQANQVALQTAGNNIANVNTPGYSRQRVVLQTVAGQFTGGGYIGKGVEVQTIQRNFSEFLTRQATLASATQSADQARSDKLQKLEGIFGGGASGLGASVSDMLNAFSDVASAPTDLTARAVVLTKVDETAARMRSASQSLDDLQTGVSQELAGNVVSINSLAKSIAAVNGKIAIAQGAGQPPNDLLDQRDQLVRQLNQYVQTSSVPANDGTVSIFIGGSQALVLGDSPATVSLVSDDFGDSRVNKLAISRGGATTTVDENILGGGSVSGLLRFQNTDLNEGRNLLGRLTTAITTSMNTQHQLGVDMDGNAGGNLFTPITFTGQNIRTPVAPATLNSGSGALTLSISDPSKFVASDYEVDFTGAAAGTITRRSDGVVTAFPQVPSTAPYLATLDGLNISLGGTPNAGDRFLIKPYSTAASTITSVFSSPRALAMASPVAGNMGANNTGTLQQTSLTALNNPPAATPVKLTFTGANSFTRSDELPIPNTTSYTYTPGQAINATDWSVTLQGGAKAGDTYTVKPNPYPSLSAGNATAMLGLRDKPLFDGAVLTDGYAGLIAQVGTRAQSASYAAQVSTTIATNAEQDRTAVSGVNLDEEAANLLQYQQAYQASAKMIQIAQSIFDTLIQGMGR